MSTGKFKIVDGEMVELTADEVITPTAEELAAEEAREARAIWLMNRQMAYPNIADQLDQIYWDQINGTTVWKDSITTVKEAHPKDG